MTALIFDCDGVLSDTERDGHLAAFNATFEHFGLPVRWTEEDYAEKLRIGGGKERLASLLTPGFIARVALPAEETLQQQFIAQWHRYKTAQYTTMVRAGDLPPRPGIARIAAAASAAGWQLAVASTSAEQSVQAVLGHVVGTELAEKFSVFAGDMVPRKKPAPDIYVLALRGLEVDPSEAIVVEDSSVGLRAALGAGLTTVITQSSYTIDEDFTGAALVVDTLGDFPAYPTRVVTNPHQLDIDATVTLDDLRALLNARPTP
ncbi:HAD-IA family hydrolase [Phycicoccus sp. BSK3Z-2]|uniref:HAD-IA family hydrolase n=1 Tax=Phycicoccus avicenniae TaxID=2828860 RepID=A0A941D491_9MICO|nr:HAD-IA family hydrolase [Phycicoccus avicenniae]MBR7741819.1 HAD-IA family hydrolase [Phycicoccus avicenniae]